MPNQIFLYFLNALFDACSYPFLFIYDLVFSLQQKDFWKSELRDFSSKNGYDLNRTGNSGPLLLDVLEGYLKFEVWHLAFLLAMFSLLTLSTVRE